MDSAISLNEKLVDINETILDSPHDFFFEKYETNDNSLFFFPIDLSQLWKHTFQLKNRKDSGIDGIPADVSKSNFPVIGPFCLISLIPL